jgi:hypothetical protein
MLKHAHLRTLYLILFSPASMTLLRFYNCTLLPFCMSEERTAVAARLPAWKSNCKCWSLMTSLMLIRLYSAILCAAESVAVALELPASTRSYRR